MLFPLARAPRWQATRLPRLRRSLLLLLLLIAAAVLWTLAGTGRVHAAGRKRRDPSIAVRFHAQTTTTDPTFAANITAGNPPRQLYVEKIPSISERDIISFYPYRAADGTFSAAFQLDPHGRATLESMSTEKRGMFIVAAVGGKPVTLLAVDKKITDGVIFIPSGLSEANIRALGESFDITGVDYSLKKGHKPKVEEPETGLPKPVL